MSKKLSPNQKAFNKVWKRAKNKVESLSTDGHSCLYRGKNGLRCFAGVLIPDRVYKANFERKSACMSPVREELEQLGYNPEFCEILQDVHDCAHPNMWEGKLINIAKEYNLKIPSN